MKTSGGAKRVLDCQGHGSHVAGVICGRKIGITPNVSLSMIPIVGCSDNVSLVAVVRALHYLRVVLKKPAVINLSISQSSVAPASSKTPGGRQTRFEEFDTLIATLSHFTQDLGVPVVMASGNDGLAECPPLQSKVPDAIVVGAITESLELASFSNSGACVSVYAPGTNVLVRKYKQKLQFISVHT